MKDLGPSRCNKMTSPIGASAFWVDALGCVSGSAGEENAKV
jgi:hypothetical protein